VLSVQLLLCGAAGFVLLLQMLFLQAASACTQATPAWSLATSGCSLELSFMHFTQPALLMTTCLELLLLAFPLQCTRRH
jgi:hypothetical protein